MLSLPALRVQIPQVPAIHDRTKALYKANKEVEVPAIYKMVEVLREHTRTHSDIKTEFKTRTKKIEDGFKAYMDQLKEMVTSDCKKKASNFAFAFSTIDFSPGLSVTFDSFLQLSLDHVSFII